MADWMAFNVADYVANTLHLTTRQHGGYILLICAAWNGKGFLPGTDEGLRAIAKLSPREWKDDGPALKAFLTKRGEAWVHERVEFEWNDAQSLIAAKSRAGAAGGRAKWAGRAQGRAHAETRAQRLAAARAIGTHTAEEWIALVNICGGKCVACDSAAKVVKDHIKPIYQGGSDSIDNLQPLCSSCNSSKGPDATDRRPPDWRERLAECLADARQTAAPTPLPSPRPVTTTSSVANSAPHGASHTPRSQLIPDDFEPSEADLAALRKERPDLVGELYAQRMADFRDWCRATAARSFSPVSTWRGFMRKTKTGAVAGETWDQRRIRLIEEAIR